MIRCRDLQFAYPGNAFRLTVDRVDVEPGKTVAIVGASGSGKTTFVHLLSGILAPESGEIEIGEIVVSNLLPAERREFRLGKIGQIPQHFALLDYLTVFDNILVPVLLRDGPPYSIEAKRRARELAGRAGIESLLDRFPDQLSQGERQRVALCRGLVHEPELILADEPTGNLDPENEATVLELMIEETKRRGSTLLMITHEHSILDRFDEVLDLEQLQGKGGEG
ncbi:MAG: ABC transporter ATP-binding protein [Verrucomicrobiota bacterium]